MEMHTREEKLAAFGRLLDVLDNLREKCPWDRKQTNESLRPNTIEETFELCDALMKDDTLNIEKELGDVLLHICFYAKIGSEKGQFDIADVCNKLCDKLIFRHPHVYGDTVAQTAGEVDKREDVWQKVREEMGELEQELKREDNRERQTEEYGDFLFSLINAGRLYHLNPDNALEHTNQKFIRRFGYVEQQAKAMGKELRDMTLAEMDELWNEAKQEERKGQ